MTRLVMLRMDRIPGDNSLHSAWILGQVTVNPYSAWRRNLTLKRVTVNGPGWDGKFTPMHCCRYALETRFGVSRDGCHERLVRALAPWGIPAARLPAPLNLFFTVWIEPSGRIGIGEQTLRPGDGITLRAEMDCLVAVAACSAPRPDGENTGYRLTLSGPPPVARTG